MKRAGQKIGMTLLAFFLALSTTNAIAQEEEKTPSEGSIAVDLASKATITADDARRAAEETYPGATVRAVDLAVEDGFLFYVVEMGEGEGDAEERKVLVDAGNSSIVVAEGEEEGGTIAMDLGSMARIDQDAARQAVLTELPGAEIREIDLAVKDGYLVYKAKAAADGQEYKVLVDAGDGRVLKRVSEEAREEAEIKAGPDIEAEPDVEAEPEEDY